MTEDDYDYGVRLSDGSMWEEDISRDFAEAEAGAYNQFNGQLSKLHATVVRAPARVWEEVE
jgi:hypothetical protein